MIGDTTVDMRAGKAAGAQTVGVLCGFGEEDELRQLGADLILNSTSDLPELFMQEPLPTRMPLGAVEGAQAQRNHHTPRQDRK